MFSYTLTPKTMNLVIGNKIHTLDESHVNYATIRDAVKRYSCLYTYNARDAVLAGVLEQIKGWLDVKTFISKFTEGAIQVGEDAVLFHGQPVKGVIADRLIALVAEGFSPAPLARFLLKLQSNPTASARDELYLWLETSNLPICDDGDFLAYKSVRDDYLSHHDGVTDNGVGKTLEMPRQEVDPDRENHCSVGFHFCSLDYLSTYGGHGRTIILKIDPADVVAIPSDYSNQKGRAWRYKVVDEVANESRDKYLEGVKIAQITDDGSVTDGGEGVVFEVENPTFEDFVSDVLSCTEVPVVDYGLVEEASWNEVAPITVDGSQRLPPEIITGKFEVTLSNGERTITLPELKAMLKEHGQRGTSRLTGIARTTLQYWIDKFNLA